MPVGFGSSLRDRWPLDPAVAYLNHGTVGSPPRRVLEHQRQLVDRIERHPARFMLRELADPTASGQPSLMREAAAQVASFVGADGRDVVFVDNATAGINAVLRSFPFERGDEIVITALGYGGIAKAADRAARVSGATLRTIALPGPGAPPEEFVEAVTRGISAATRVVVVDHLTSSTALVLPIAEIAAAAHERGVLVLVDGAHVPGNVALDIESLGVDWYVANLHKWAWAPRSCGILWTSAAQQQHLFPTVTSWGLDNGLAAEFDLPGTRDPSPFLTAPFAIDLMREYGLEAVYAYNHAARVVGCAASRRRVGRAVHDARVDDRRDGNGATPSPSREHRPRRRTAAGLARPARHRGAGPGRTRRPRGTHLGADLLRPCRCRTSRRRRCTVRLTTAT